MVTDNPHFNDHNIFVTNCDLKTTTKFTDEHFQSVCSSSSIAAVTASAGKLVDKSLECQPFRQRLSFVSQSCPDNIRKQWSSLIKTNEKLNAMKSHKSSKYKFSMVPLRIKCMCESKMYPSPSSNPKVRARLGANQQQRYVASANFLKKKIEYKAKIKK
jgi:hypothetical protein